MSGCGKEWYKNKNKETRETVNIQKSTQYNSYFPMNGEGHLNVDVKGWTARRIVRIFVSRGQFRRHAKRALFHNVFGSFLSMLVVGVDF